MKIGNDAESYGLVNKLLHWLIAALIIALLVIGWLMVDLGYYDPWYHDSLSWHKSLGIIVAIVVALKLIWRLNSAPPQFQKSLSVIEKSTARSVHWLLLTGMIVIPISGFLISTSEGAAIGVFNWFSVPAFIVVSESNRDFAINIHYYFAYGALGLIIVHTTAALKHQFIDHKDTLKRML